jgi:hypothetical protein
VIARLQTDAVAFVQDRRRGIEKTRAMPLFASVFFALWLPASTPAAAVAPPAITDLAWLEGHWRGSSGPLQMEEIWTSATGGALVGLHKDVSARDGAARMVSFEFLRIEAGADGIAYVAQPGGRPPVRFPLIEVTGRRAVFANPAHDFPQRILYWVDEAGALHARVEGAQGGRTVGEEWTWQK